MGIYKIPRVIGIGQKPPFGARVNPYHPLSQGLVGAWLLNEYGGDTLFNLLGNPQYLTKGALSMVWSEGGTTFTPSGYAFAKYIPIVGSMTCAFIFKSTATNGGLMYFSEGKLTTIVFDRTIYYKDGLIKMRWWDSLHPADWLTSSSTVNDGNFQNVVCINSSQAPGKKIYINGKLDAADAKAYGYAGYNGYTDPYIQFATAFSDHDSVQYYLNGTIKLFLIWNRVLTDEEVVSFNANPYQMFEWPVGDYYFVPSVAAGLSIPVAMYHLRQQGIS